jgi:hypothetical protein
VKQIKFASAVVCLVVLWGLSCRAQVPAIKPAFPERVWHFAGHHKELLAADAIAIMAEAADSASSVHCQRIPGCTETNSQLGRHPSELSTWGQSMGLSSLLIAGNAVIWHFAADPFDRHVMWLGTGALAIDQIFNVNNNVNIAEGLQNGQNKSATFAAAKKSGILK